MKNKSVPVYLHIPYCDNICHYCDFAKTANWDAKVASSYLKKLESHVLFWADFLKKNNSTISSLFFGGGTPGIFSNEYEKIFKTLSPYFEKNVEITLEANPSNLTNERMHAWEKLGVNRLSVGVQSFDDEVLKFLVRDHSGEYAKNAISEARKIFENVNLDLIYGVPGQTLDSFNEDLDQAIELGINHISLYNLTFEPGTPIGRAFNRGKIKEDDIELEFEFYKQAMIKLKESGFNHEEVSNWSKEGYSCDHNWAYWTMRPYISAGSGAHGYLRENDSDLGQRYYFGKNDRSFKGLELSHQNLLDSLSKSGASIEKRVHEDLAVEYVTTSLRTNKGIPLSKIKDISGKSFKATSKLENALKEGYAYYSEDNTHLIFSPECWFFENQWGIEVLDSFK